VASVKRILLVDDDRVTNLMHRRQIARGDFAEAVDVATDGQAALSYIENRKSRGERQPELVLLDVNMPRMNGFEFLAAYADLPSGVRQCQTIVMVSTSGLQQDVDRANADPNVRAYYVKPLADSDFQRIVDACSNDPGV